MNYRDYIKNGKLILPEGFNNELDCNETVYKNLYKII